MTYVPPNIERLVPSTARVTIGISAPSTPSAAMRDVCHAVRFGKRRSTTSTTTIVATRTMSGAKACQSIVGFTSSPADRLPDGRGHGMDRDVGDLEEQVGEDAEHHDHEEHRRPREPLERVHVVDVRVGELVAH